MISKNFVKESDEKIQRIRNMGIVFGNGNVLLLKPRVENKTSGGIHLPDDVRSDPRHSQRKRNFARILAIPNNLDIEHGDLDLKVGDYCFYTYVAENALNPAALSLVFGELVINEDDGSNSFLTYTTDAEVICTIPAEKVHGLL